MIPDTAITAYHQNLEALIDGWLYQKKTSKSGSEKTALAYRTTLTSYRETLRRGGLDLDSQEIAKLAQIAVIWAGMRTPRKDGKIQEGEVSPSTYNQRLAIVSSFYTYCQKQAQAYTGGGEIANPIKSSIVERRGVQAYAAAQALDSDTLPDQLASIDRRTLQGKRDYALLAVALSTGRRASELVALRWRHLKLTSKKVLITFEHCKGGKVMRDQLDPDVSRVLMEYLHAVYGSKLGSLESESPIWVSFSRQNKGQAISTHTLNDICEKYLETTKIHTLRHTFAVEMEKAHAPISEIAARLGHTNEQITSRYLKQVRSAENPYAGIVAARLGIGKK